MQLPKVSTFDTRWLFMEHDSWQVWTNFCNFVFLWKNNDFEVSMLTLETFVRAHDIKRFFWICFFRAREEKKVLEVCQTTKMFLWRRKKTEQETRKMFRVSKKSHISCCFDFPNNNKKHNTSKALQQTFQDQNCRLPRSAMSGDWIFEKSCFYYYLIKGSRQIILLYTKKKQVKKNTEKKTFLRSPNAIRSREQNTNI